MRHLLLASLLFAGCHQKSEPPPAQPFTGAPVAFIGSNVTPGDNHKGAVDVKEYNFSDKRVAQYWILLRYHDASGAVLKTKPGTAFEADFDFWSFSGKRFLCEPASWCSYKLDNLDVPEKAASVEILAKDVTALKDDVHFDDKPLFELQGMAWPTKK